MSEPLISVLMLTYHPQKDALFSTLRSIVLQADCDFEVIVCDDGSGEFFREEIEHFLKANGVNYQILAHPENQGTVKNILDGAKIARGHYIKPISPGDYLYDAHTLRDIGDFMVKQDAAAAFGSSLQGAETAGSVRRSDLRRFCRLRKNRPDSRPGGHLPRSTSGGGHGFSVLFR